MKSRAIVMLGLVCASAAAAFVSWRHQVARNAPPPTKVAIVIDASDSMQPGCRNAVAVIQGTMHSPGVKPGSTLTIIRTGDVATRLEPQLVFNEPIPAAVTGPFGGNKKAKQKQAEFLARVQAACTSIEQIKTSPIVKAVRQALAHLKHLGCPRAAGCILVVHSDLQDNDELAGQKPKAKQQSLDNAGIKVMLCGFTGTVEDGYMVKTDDLQAVWQGLFTEPVTFAPFCGTGAS